MPRYAVADPWETESETLPTERARDTRKADTMASGNSERGAHEASLQTSLLRRSFGFGNPNAANSLALPLSLWLCSTLASPSEEKEKRIGRAPYLEIALAARELTIGLTITSLLKRNLRDTHIHTHTSEAGSQVGRTSRA